MQFWPDDNEPFECDNFRVRYESKINKCDYVCRDFVLDSLQDDDSLTVRLFHCPCWPEMTTTYAIFDFIVDIHTPPAENRNGPIAILDRYVSV